MTFYEISPEDSKNACKKTFKIPSNSDKTLA